MNLTLLLQAILLKADLLFETKRFPEAMQFYKRGVTLRPDVTNFTRGVDFTYRNMKLDAIGLSSICCCIYSVLLFVLYLTIHKQNFLNNSVNNSFALLCR